MSRLDSAIRRLQAQRACLNDAAARIAGQPGPIFELGLGNGRTYDHLRGLLPDRDIFVFERKVAAHPDCCPPEERLFLGDIRQTLPMAVQDFGGEVALLHADVGSGDSESAVRPTAVVAEGALALLRPGGLLLCDQDLGDVVDPACLEPLPLPEGVPAERYFYYRRIR